MYPGYAIKKIRLLFWELIKQSLAFRKSSRTTRGGEAIQAQQCRTLFISCSDKNIFLFILDCHIAFGSSQ